MNGEPIYELPEGVDGTFRYACRKCGRMVEIVDTVRQSHHCRIDVDALHGKPKPSHNHMTRDVKQPGVCPGCDVYHHRINGLAERVEPPADEQFDAIAEVPERDVDALVRLEMAFTPFHEACAAPGPPGSPRHGGPLCHRSRGHARDFHACDFPYTKWAIT